MALETCSIGHGLVISRRFDGSFRYVHRVKGKVAISELNPVLDMNSNAKWFCLTYNLTESLLGYTVASMRRLGEGAVLEGGAQWTGRESDALNPCPKSKAQSLAPEWHIGLISAKVAQAYVPALPFEPVQLRPTVSDQVRPFSALGYVQIRKGIWLGACKS